MNDEERKEWFRVSRSGNGVGTVTVTVQEGNQSVKWSVRAYSNDVKKGLVEAKAGAEKALAQLQAAVEELAA